MYTWGGNAIIIRVWNLYIYQSHINLWYSKDTHFQKSLDTLKHMHTFCKITELWAFKTCKVRRYQYIQMWLLGPVRLAWLLGVIITAKGICTFLFVLFVMSPSNYQGVTHTTDYRSCHDSDGRVTMTTAYLVFRYGYRPATGWHFINNYYRQWNELVRISTNLCQVTKQGLKMWTFYDIIQWL